MLFRVSVLLVSFAVLSEAISLPVMEDGLAFRSYVRDDDRLYARQNRASNGGNRNGGNNGNTGNTGNSAASASAASASAAAKAATNNNNGNKNSATTSASAATATKATNNNGNTGNTGNNAAAAVTLKANAIQTGSANDGQNPPVAGQAASATSNENFVNFCSGQTLTNGLQTKGGSCNGIVMGKIPSTSNMISAIIVSPKPAEQMTANKDFTVSVQTKGLTAGSFTNAAATYYSAPQDLASNGQVIGHTHVTIQTLGNSLQPTTAPDPTAFVFFKGINDAGNGNGLLSATVTGGLPAGNYRVCSMTSSSNHQPVLMPVAQRGAQDDCQKFTVK